jgi:hypothetical protein
VPLWLRPSSARSSVTSDWLTNSGSRLSGTLGLGRSKLPTMRLRLEAALAEVLAAAQDVLIGVRAIREAHQRRTKYRYYVRLSAVMWDAIPKPGTWQDLIQYPTLRSALGAALELDRENTEAQRMIAIDTANVVTPKVNRFFAVAALLTLGEDKQVTDAVRQLTPKVTTLVERAGTNKRDFERLSTEMQKALEQFRDVADRRLGNVEQSSAHR